MNKKCIVFLHILYFAFHAYCWCCLSVNVRFSRVQNHCKYYFAHRGSPMLSYPACTDIIEIPRYFLLKRDYRVVLMSRAFHLYTCILVCIYWLSWWWKYVMILVTRDLSCESRIAYGTLETRWVDCTSLWQLQARLQINSKRFLKFNFRFLFIRFFSPERLLDNYHKLVEILYPPRALIVGTELTSLEAASSRFLHLLSQQSPQQNLDYDALLGP